MNEKIIDYTWDRKTHRYVLKSGVGKPKKAKPDYWDKAYYGECLDIADHNRNVLLAVVTIFRRRYKWSKGKAFRLGNKELKECGFSRKE